MTNQSWNNKKSETLTWTVETNGAVSWALNKDIVKLLAGFERKFLRRMFGRIKVNEKWRKR